MFKSLQVFVLFLHVNYAFSKKYTNYTLYRGIPVTEGHLNFMKNIAELYKVDFWRSPGMVQMPVEFTIGPEEKHLFLREAADQELYLTTIIEDVQSALDMQTVKTYIRRKMDSFDWGSYFRLKDIYTWLSDLSKAHPKVMELIKIGKTHENRDILAAKIVLENSHRRSTVIVEGGIHAREWIAPAVVTYMLHQILTAPTSKDEELRRIAESYEWYFVPVLNADGYEYSHTEDRLWRKNRNGRGTDLNRNFGIAFGSIGVSAREQDDTFCGTKPFSERESSAMANFVRSKSKYLEYYIAFHSYGQYIIIPYAHTNKHLDNFDEMLKIGQEVASNISRKHGTKYAVGSAYDTVGYMTSGVSGCWAKKSFGIPYVATFELRDDGHHGFALPPKEILNTCMETMDGMVSLLTPRTQSLRKLKDRPERTSGSDNTFLDNIVIIFNALLFIIVRFD